MTPADPRAELVAKAMKDPAFRAELKKDPAAAIEKALGLKLPKGLSVKVVEDGADVVHLVLPAAENALSEKDLRTIAGGAGYVPTYCLNSAANPSGDPSCLKNG